MADFPFASERVRVGVRAQRATGIGIGIGVAIETRRTRVVPVSAWYPVVIAPRSTLTRTRTRSGDIPL